MSQQAENTQGIKRCPWPNLLNNPIYIQYHDEEWGVASYEDGYLFEMLVLESFHCGLSWLLMLKKRENFRKAFDNFDPVKIRDYDEDKVLSLMEDAGIVRNLRKIRATIDNAAAFLRVQGEFGSFRNYIWGFTDHQIRYAQDDTMHTTNALSDQVAKDMKKRGFKFMGSVTTYSYLEAIGVMNNHVSECFRYEHKRL